jgi:hypothetical protein
MRRLLQRWSRVGKLREAALEPTADLDDDVEEDAHDGDQQTLIEPEATQIDNQLEEDILEPALPADGATDEDAAAQNDLPRHADVDEPADEEAGPVMQEADEARDEANAQAMAYRQCVEDAVALARDTARSYVDRGSGTRPPPHSGRRRGSSSRLVGS